MKCLLWQQNRSVSCRLAWPSALVTGLAIDRTNRQRVCRVSLTVALFSLSPACCCSTSVREKASGCCTRWRSTKWSKSSKATTHARSDWHALHHLASLTSCQCNAYLVLSQLNVLPNPTSRWTLARASLVHAFARRWQYVQTPLPVQRTQVYPDAIEANMGGTAKESRWPHQKKQTAPEENHIGDARYTCLKLSMSAMSGYVCVGKYYILMCG